MDRHIIKKDFAMYLIFNPSYPGWIWAEVNKEGETNSDDLAQIISKMRKGVYTKKEFNIRCVPDTRDKYDNLTAKEKDCTTLGKLFVPRKIKGSQVGLRTISEKDRYKGKVDWESNRQKITDWIDEGLSLGKISKQLNVSPSALSKANKRYGLYTPKSPVARKNRRSTDIAPFSH